MNRKEITKKIVELRAESEHAQLKPGAFAFLPEIILSLNAVCKDIDAGPEKRKRISAALGRLVSEDYEFSEGSLGQALLELADEYAEMD